jgi:large subunit ribosomal protein L35
VARPKGCRGDGNRLKRTARPFWTEAFPGSGIGRERRLAQRLLTKESQMPKLKTKSGAKKRFKITGTGKVLYQQSGKRHGMIKRSTKQVRDHRGTKVLFKTDGDNIKKYWLPNS